MKAYHNMTAKKAAEELKSNLKSGLTTEEARKRLEKYGKNELAEKKKKNITCHEYHRK